MSTPLHPQNDRVGTAGIPFPPQPKPRYPPKVATVDADQLHRSALCPEIAGDVYYLIGAEEALYAYGENHCDVCRHYNTDLERDDSWTDPRYRRGDTPDAE